MIASKKWAKNNYTAEYQENIIKLIEKYPQMNTSPNQIYKILLEINKFIVQQKKYHLETKFGKCGCWKNIQLTKLQQIAPPLSNGEVRDFPLFRSLAEAISSPFDELIKFGQLKSIALNNNKVS